MNANLIHDPATGQLSPEVAARIRKIARAGNYRSPNREAEAEEIEQEAWAMVLTAISRGYQITDPVAFVSTITRNAKVNAIRGQAGRRRYEAGSLDDPSGPAWRISDGQPSMERNLIATEKAAEVRAQMDGLRARHPRQARIVDAVVLEGYAVAEVARMEGIEAPRVSTEKHRGLQDLRRRLLAQAGTARAGPAKSASASSSCDRNRTRRRPPIVKLFGRRAIAVEMAA